MNQIKGRVLGLWMAVCGVGCEAALTLTVNNGEGSGRYAEGLMVSVAAAPSPTGQVFKQWSGGNGFVEDIYAPLTRVRMSAFDLRITAIYRTHNSCGLTDIDRIRTEVKSDPETHTGNMAGRRAALYRWWRLLWHQGCDMSPFDDVADDLVFRDNADAWAMKAVTRGYAVLEKIQAEGRHIEQVAGKPSSSTTKTDWPVYHGTDGHQSGYSPDAGPSEGKLAWRYPVGHRWYAEPVISNGRVYAAGAGTDVIGYCLDEKSGEVIWKARQYGLNFYSTTGTKWTPVVSQDRVLFHTGYYQSAKIFIVDKGTGAEVASRGAGSIETGDPAEAAVYQNMRWNAVLADARTGRRIWTFKSGGLLAGDPVLDGDKVYAARLSGEVYQLSTASPVPVWTRKIAAGVRGKPSLGKALVYVGDADRTLHALRKTDGAVRWSFRADETENKAYQFFSGAVESDGRVYAGAASGYLYCLDATDGRLIWKHKVSDWVRSRPVVVEGNVYVATLDSRVYALEDKGGSASVRWQRKVGEHGFTADLAGNRHGILASGRDVVLYSLSPATGYVQWRHGQLEQVWVDGRPHAAEVIGGQYMSSPTIVDGRAYIGGPDGFARALDADTGRLLWRYETSGQIKAALTVADGKVFIPQTSGHDDFHVADRITGEPIWTSDKFGWVFPGVGYAADNKKRIYVAAMSGKVFGVDAGTGGIEWTSEASSKGLYPSPVTDVSRFYTGGHDGCYRAWNLDAGDVEWSLKTGFGPGGNPDSAGMVMWQDRLYVQRAGRFISALDPADGKVEWEWSVPNGYLQNGTVAACDNRIFGSAIRGAVELPYRSIIYAFNNDDHEGTPLWSYSAGGGGGGLTGPVTAPGKLIFGSTAGVFMTCLNSEDGGLKWRCYTGGAMEEAVPAVYGKMVFFLSRNGYFNAVK